MGTYADELIEREIRAYGQRRMREELRMDDLHQASIGSQADRQRLNKRAEQFSKDCGVAPGPTVNLDALRAFAAEPDDPLTVQTPSQHHVQIRTSAGKVLAEWWPSKGTTMMDGVRGPRCKSAAAVVEWLRSA